MTTRFPSCGCRSAQYSVSGRMEGQSLRPLRVGMAGIAYGETKCAKKLIKDSDGKVIDVQGDLIPKLTTPGKNRPECEQICIRRHEQIHAADPVSRKSCNDYQHYKWLYGLAKPGKQKAEYARLRDAAKHKFEDPARECGPWLDSLRCAVKMECQYKDTKNHPKCPYPDEKVGDAAAKVKRYCKYDRDRMKKLLDDLKAAPG